MIKLYTTPVFSPADAGGAATADASAGASETVQGSEMARVVQSMIVPKKEADATLLKKKGPPPEEAAAEPEEQARPVGDDTAPRKDAGDTSEEVGSEEPDGGQSEDDDDFDAFSSVGSTSDASQGEDDDSRDAQRFTVTVDGNEVEVTLDDLRRSYAGSQAIERRLQEATEHRNAVEQERNALNAERATFIAETQSTREAFAHSIQALKALIAAPQVKRPDPALRQSNPTQYALAMADFQQDQERVNTLALEVDKKLAEYNQYRQETLVQTKQQESQKLAQAMPALLDPTRGPVIQKRIATAAAKAGFTQQEIAMAADHRLFLMAAAAGEYWRMMDKQKAAREQAAKQQAQAQTAVSARGSTVVTPQNRAKTEMANRMNKAATSGDVKDIAATLIVPKPKARRN